jgi:diguanylate cyclase (GGDEF)-like protein
MKRRQTAKDAPRTLLAYLLMIELVALAGVAAAVLRAQWSGHAAGIAGLVLGLAVLFEECTRKAGSLRIKLSEQLKPDMTSVWACAAALTLPAAFASVVVALLLTYVWFRVQRPSGEPFYRKIATASTILIGCLLADVVAGATGAGARTSWHGIAATLTIVTGLLAYTLVNRLLVTGAIVLLGARGRDLLGTRDDNMVEVATLCLGGLASVALLHQPWTIVLVLLPMGLLQRSAVVRQLEIAASTDGRTGLWTAVAWEHLSHREISRAQREQQPVAVLMVDLDRFKSINDTFGHFVGDVVLKAVGQRLRTELRGYDLIGRLGGEEFVGLLPGVDADAAMVIAERLRIAIADARIGEYPKLTDQPAEVRVTVSIGVGASPGDGHELTELMHAADAALYAAKRGGRNQVRRLDAQQPPAPAARPQIIGQAHS